MNLWMILLIICDGLSDRHAGFYMVARWSSKIVAHSSTSTANTIYVSVISLFEIAIKQKINKLPDLPVTTGELVERMNQDGFELLPLTSRHIAHYTSLPLVPDHRDPFDRILLATAFAERIPLISADEHFSQYTDWVTVIW